MHERLIIDGNSVYEVDEECLKRRNVPTECRVKEAVERHPGGHFAGCRIKNARLQNRRHIGRFPRGKCRKGGPAAAQTSRNSFIKKTVKLHKAGSKADLSAFPLYFERIPALFCKLSVIFHPAQLEK